MKQYISMNRKTPEALTDLGILPLEVGRGSVRFRDRLMYGLLGFAATLLAVEAGAILVSQFLSIPAPEVQRVAAFVAFPVSIAAGIAVGKGYIGALRGR